MKSLNVLGILLDCLQNSYVRDIFLRAGTSAIFPMQRIHLNAYSATLSIIIYSLICLCRARRTSRKIKLVYTMTRFQLRANWKRSRLNWSSVNRLAMFLLINLASALHADYPYPTPYRELVYACVMPLKLCFIGNILLMCNYVYDRTCMWGSKSLP